MAGKVFVSSSSDTPSERKSAIALIEKLGAQYRVGVTQDHQHAYVFERDDDIGASARPIQEQIRSVNDDDIELVVVILGERVGLPLPPDTNVPERVRRLLDGAALRPYFTYPGQENPTSGATPLTGVLYEVFEAIAGDKRHVFLCKGPETEIFKAAEQDVWRRNFGCNDYERSFRQTNDGQYRPPTDDERAFLKAQRVGLQRLYDHVLTGRERIAFQSILDFEGKLAAALHAWWRREGEETAFLGLQSFGLLDAKQFRGRDSERDDALIKLAAAHANAALRPRLLITGRSGVGKSSFAVAGLAARLQQSGTAIAGHRFKPVVLTPASIRNRAADESASFAIAREIASATADERLLHELEQLPPKARDATSVTRIQRLVTDLRNGGAPSVGEAWLPFVVMDQLEIAFEKGGKAFEEAFAEVIAYLDQLAADRSAWVVYVLADTSSRSPKRKRSGWLELWDQSAAIQQVHAASPFEPFELDPLGPEQLLAIFAATFAHAGIEVAPDALDAVRRELRDLITSDSDAGFEYEHLLPLLAVSMQISERRRQDRLRRRIEARLTSKADPVTRATWMSPTARDIRTSPFVIGHEGLQFEDVMPLGKAIDRLAEDTFSAFVRDRLGIPWWGSADGDLAPAPPEAERMLHTLLRWLVAVSESAKTLDWSLVQGRERRRATVTDRMGPQGEAFLEDLQRARLVRTDKQINIRLSHVALIRQWSRARAWCEAEFSLLRAYREVQSTREGGGSPATPAQLKAWRPLYVAWGMDGPWRAEQRGSGAEAGTDLAWLRAQFRREALAIDNKDRASRLLFAILRAGDDELCAEILTAWAPSKELSTAFEIPFAPDLDPRRSPPIVLAAEMKPKRTFEMLAERAKKPFAQNLLRQSAFHVLAARGDAEKIKILTQRLPQANPSTYPKDWPPNLPALYGWTPLHLAAKSGSKRAVSAIADAMELIGARPAMKLHAKAPRFAGATALHFAARQRRGVAEAMLERIIAVTRVRKSDPRGIADDAQFLPLHLAVTADDADAVRLLAQGRPEDLAVRTHPDGAGVRHTAVTLAARRGADNALIALLKAAPDDQDDWAIGKEALRLAAGYGEERIVSRILAHRPTGALPAMLDQDAHGRTAVHLAAQFRHVAVLERLFAHPGAEAVINQPDPMRGYAPLHWACFYNDPLAEERIRAAIALLVSRGADRKLRCKDGLTPFQVALKYKVRTAYEMLAHDLSDQEIDEGGVFDLLNTRDQAFICGVLEHCPPGWLRATGPKGASPLHRAAFYGLKEVVALLVRRAPDLLARRSEKERTPLHEAAAARSTEANAVAEILANAGADLMAKDAEERTALHVAAFNANTDMARFFVARARDNASVLVNLADQHDKTPLHCAAEAGDADTIRLLLRHGAQPHARAKEDEGARTPAHLAAFYGGAAALAALAESDDTILDDRSTYGDTVLHCAASGSRLAVVEWLIAHHRQRVVRDMAVASGSGATPYGAALGGWAALSASEKSSGEETARQGAARFKPSVESASAVVAQLQDLLPAVFGNALPDDPSMVAAAVRAGDAELFRRFIDQGAPVVAPNGSRASPLHSAVQAGDENMVREILALGGARAAQSLDQFDRTPLHVAAQWGYRDLADILIEAGVSIVALDVRGRTAGDLAFHGGHMGVVELLETRAGAGVNIFRAPRSGDFSALFESAKIDDVATISAILARVSDEGVRDVALRLCVGWGAVNALKAKFRPDDPGMVSEDENGDFALLRAVRFGRHSVLEWVDDDLLRSLADQKLERGETLLHHAARYGHTEICRRLVACGFDPAGQDGGGRTPLHRAAMTLRPGTVTFLGEFPMACAATDRHGRTALHAAAEVKATAERATLKQQTIAALLDAGFDPLIPDAKGRLALDLVQSQGDEQSMFLLFGGARTIEMEDDNSKALTTARQAYARTRLSGMGSWILNTLMGLLLLSYLLTWS
jgi:ankyrin repeat protein